MSTNPATISATIQSLLDEKGLTMSGLARIEGLSPSTIHERIKSTSFSRLRTYIKWAQALDLTLDEFYSICREPEAIRQRMNEIGIMSISELARRSGISQPACSQLLNRRNNFASFDNYNRLAHRLGVTLQQLAL